MSCPQGLTAQAVTLSLGPVQATGGFSSIPNLLPPEARSTTPLPHPVPRHCQMPLGAKPRLYRSHTELKHGDANRPTVHLATPLDRRSAPAPVPRGPGLGETWNLCLLSPHTLNLEDTQSEDPCRSHSGRERPAVVGRGHLRLEAHMVKDTQLTNKPTLMERTHRDPGATRPHTSPGQGVGRFGAGMGRSTDAGRGRCRGQGGGGGCAELSLGLVCMCSHVCTLHM